MKAFPYKQHKAKLLADLEQARSTGLKVAVILLTKGCCKECDELNETRLSYEEALDKQLLPYKSCTKLSGCCCCYGFETLRDENGRLIRFE